MLKRSFKTILKFFLGLLLMLLVVLALIQIPAVQTKIVSFAINKIEEKTGAQVSIRKLYMSFPKRVIIKDLLIRDESDDTLVFIGEGALDISLFPLLTNAVKIRKIEFENLKANIYRRSNEQDFNFQFLVDGFETKENPEPDAKENWTFKPGTISLKNHDIKFLDSLNESYHQLKLEDITIRFRELDFSHGEFDITSIALNGVFYDLWIGSNAETEMDDKPDNKISYLINSKKISAKNISFNFAKEGEIELYASLEESDIEPVSIDLTNRKLEFSSVSFTKPFTKLILFEEDTVEEVTDTSIFYETFANTLFGPIGWFIQSKEIQMEKGHFSLDYDDSLQSVGFDYRHMKYEDIHLEAEDILFSDSLILAKIENVKVRDKNTVQIREFQSSFVMGPSGIVAENFNLQTGGSAISGHLAIHYPHLRKILDDPGKLQFIADIENASLSGKEVNYYMPQFNGKDHLSFLTNRQFQFSIDLNGFLSDLDLSHFTLKAGEQLELDLNGKMEGLPDLRKVHYDLNIEEFSCKSSLFGKAIDTIFRSRIPEEWSISGNLGGDFYSVTSNLTLQSSLGDISAIGFLNYNEGHPDSSNFRITTQKLEIGKLIGNDKLGPVDFNIHLRSADLARLKGEMTGQVDQFIFNQYEYGGLTFDISSKEKINYQFSSDDQHVNFKLIGEANLLDSGVNFDYTFDINRIDFNSLNISKKEFEVSGKIKGQNEYAKGQGYNGQTSIKNLTIKTDTLRYLIKSTNILSDIQADKVNFQINSDNLNGFLKSNVGIDELASIFESQIGNYIPLKDSVSDLSDRYVEFDFDFKDIDMLARAFNDNIKKLEIEKCRGYYDGRSQKLTGELVISDFSYSKIDFKNIDLTLLSNYESLAANLNIDRINYDTLYVDHLNLNALFSKGLVEMRILKKDSIGITQYSFHNNLFFSENNIELLFPDKSLTWNYQTWDHSGDSTIFLRDSVNAVSFVKDNQKIMFRTDNSELSIDFIDFDISNFISALSRRDSVPIIAGEINGTASLITYSPFDFEIDLDFDDCKYKGNDLGTIRLFLAGNDASSYKYSLGADYRENRLLLKGDYVRNQQNYDYHIDLLVRWSDMDYFGQFFPDIKNMKGNLDGEATFIGSNTSFAADGSIDLNGIEFHHTMLNTGYTVTEGSLKFDNYDAILNDIMVFDQNDHPLSITGKINYSRYPRFEYDINIRSENFKLLNNTIKENKTFFGALNVSTEINLKGDNNKPIVNANIKIEPGTDLTYIFPGQDLELISDEGIIVWNEEEINKEISPYFATDSLSTFFWDYYLNTNLEINKDASFTLIVDPNSGDVAKFNLFGKLSLIREANQNPKVTGVLEAQSGYYEMSFYGLIKKKFELDKGSKVIWSGDLLDAHLDIQARNGIKTNSAALVANETGGVEGSQYNQRLDYFIILKIQGSLKEPSVYFLLDMKEEYKYSYALIANKLEQLNLPENEAERNKQVFALLVTGSFITDVPVAGSGSSGNTFATSAARNSVNGILTHQLNNLTSQYIKFVDFSMGVNTYENYSPGMAETRTDLDLQVSKKMFNDRVSVEVESSINLESNETYKGNKPGKATSFEYAVSYQLTESGNYRIKAFQENAYDLFDGEIQNSGIAFIFIKEFNPKNSNQKDGTDNSSSKKNELLKPEEVSVDEDKE